MEEKTFKTERYIGRIGRPGVVLEAQAFMNGRNSKAPYAPTSLNRIQLVANDTNKGIKNYIANIAADQLEYLQQVNNTLLMARTTGNTAAKGSVIAPVPKTLGTTNDAKTHRKCYTLSVDYDLSREKTQIMVKIDNYFAKVAVDSNGRQQIDMRSRENITGNVFFVGLTLQEWCVLINTALDVYRDRRQWRVANDQEYGEFFVPFN